MTEAEVIVIGGGPAGSTCAWRLREAGVETLLLDKQVFPRSKPCAGWITPKAVRDLKLDLDSYPLSLARFSVLYFHFGKRTVPLPTRQYAIRRVEFDEWLLKRSGVPVRTHAVAQIRKEGGYYVIDDVYRCRYLVGAGGTLCPVYRTFFRHICPRPEQSQITAMEDEFPAATHEKKCHLWFAEDNLPGYSWYVPKGNGFVNVGIGGSTAKMRAQGVTIRHYWDAFVQKLIGLGLLGEYKPHPRGYNYFLRARPGPVRVDNAFVTGDAAGLATRDMGEGIGPAIRSGILAARAIVHRDTYNLRSISKLSAVDLLIPV